MHSTLEGHIRQSLSIDRSRRGQTGSHQLVTAVVGLVAVLGALGVYSYFYLREPQKKTPTAQSPPAATTVVPDIPLHARSVTGTIKSVTGDRLTISTYVGQGGTVRERSVIVTLTPNTTIQHVDLTPTNRLGDDGQPLPPVRTAAIQRDLTPGRFVEVTSAEPIGQLITVVASQVDILEENR